MGHVRAHHIGVYLPGALQVVRVGAASGDEPEVFDAQDRITNTVTQTITHGGSIKTKCWNTDAMILTQNRTAKSISVVRDVDAYGAG